MNPRLEDIVGTLRQGVGREKEGELVGVLSTGERCYVALAAHRNDLLPAAYHHPVEAWHRLDADWQRALCRRNDWPASWASPTRLEIAVDLHRLRLALDAADIPASTLPAGEALAERLQYLIEERDGLRMRLDNGAAGSGGRACRPTTNR